MGKRVFIVHRWGESPDSDWYEWLKDELEEKGIEVAVPEMPDTNEPVIKYWVENLDESVKKSDKDTYFVGHSIGCQTIMRYLETLPEKTKVGGAVFVAPWFGLKNLESKDEERIAKPWVTEKIDLKKVKKMIPKLITIFSDNDPHVSLKESEKFKKELGASIIVEKKKGHFRAEDGVKTPDVILEETLKVMGIKSHRFYD